MKRIALVAGLLLAACGGTSEVTEDAETVAPAPVEMIEPAETPAPLPVEPAPLAALPAGSYCYSHQDETVTEALEIVVLATGSVQGSHYGQIHDAANAYFAAFETSLIQGERAEDGTVTFQTITEVDGDVQAGEATWELSTASAQMVEDSAVFMAADCTGLMDTIWPQVE